MSQQELRNSPCLSIVSAFYNEEHTLPAFRDRVVALLDLLDRSGVTAEVVLIDDHSRDDSTSMARQWQAEDPRVTYLRLSRNCGAHSALAAGLAHSTGDCAVIMSSDLQDPPEVIPDLLSKRREGFDVVWAVRATRHGETPWTQFFSRCYYALMRRFALPEMPATGADFLIVDRKVIDVYNAIPEKHTSLMAMIMWLGFRQTSIQYMQQARIGGKSKWTLSKKVKLLLDSVLSFSYTPIRAMSLLGLTMAVCGFGYAVLVVVGRLVGTVVAGTGFAALMTTILVGQGTILFMLGMLGEYLWRTFDEARGRPRYIIEEYLASRPPARRPSPRADLTAPSSRHACETAGDDSQQPT